MYGFDEGKNKVEFYSKDDFLILEGKATVETYYYPAVANIVLPEGYTADNCVVIAKTYETTGGDMSLIKARYYYEQISNTNYTYVDLDNPTADVLLDNAKSRMYLNMYVPTSTGKTNLDIKIYESAYDQVGTTYDYKVILLRYKD